MSSIFQIWGANLLLTCLKYRRFIFISPSTGKNYKFYNLDIYPRATLTTKFLKNPLLNILSFLTQETREARSSSKSLLHLDYIQNFQKGPLCTIFESEYFLQKWSIFSERQSVRFIPNLRNHWKYFYRKDSWNSTKKRG